MQKITYQADFCSVIIGKVKTLSIGGTDNIVWGEDDRILNSPDMCENVASQGRLENLNNGIGADLISSQATQGSTVVY